MSKKRVGEIFKVVSCVPPGCKNVLNAQKLGTFDLDWYMLRLNDEGGEFYGTR